MLFSARNVGPKQYTFPERHRVRFVVQLTALRQIRGVVLEVLHGEQRGRALARSGREDRRIREDETLAIEVVADGVDDLVTDPQNGGLTLSANPEMPPIEQVVDAVLLGRDGIVVGRAHDFETARRQLVSALSALVLAHTARHDDRRFL